MSRTQLVDLGLLDDICAALKQNKMHRLCCGLIGFGNLKRLIELLFSLLDTVEGLFI